MTNSDRFVLKPRFNNLADIGLQYKDILTYITIRSFYNAKDKCCYPSYRTIAKTSGLSTNFISQSVKRLRDANMLTIWQIQKRARYAQWYKFPPEATLNKIPFKLLVDQSLTVCEKSMLLVLAEHCQTGTCYDSLTEVATKSGISHRTVREHYQALRLKGYIVQSSYEDPFDSTVTDTFFLTKIFKWDLNAFKSNVSEKEDMISFITSLARGLRRS